MRGGLDDALDKLARRDQLRRRAAGEATGTPAAVTDLVEAIAAVVSRHPHLGVTVGVEGAGDPVLLHFAFADGQVQVNADKTVVARADEAQPRHADFEIDADEPVEESYAPPRASHDDQDRFGPTDFEYVDSPTAERPYVDPPAPQQHPFAAAPPPVPPAYAPPPPSRHPFAAAPPPPVPPQQPPQYDQGMAAHRIPVQQQAAEPRFPAPLAEPIPLQVERPEETEMAARRLAALLRNDPTLLDDPPH